MKPSSSPSVRFWRWAGLVVVVNCVLIGIVLLRGDRRETLPVAISPTDGSTGVSTRPVIKLTFSRPIDPTSAAGSIGLLPPIDGQISVNGSEVDFIPAHLLAPQTSYTIDVRPGLREINGQVARRDLRYAFQTRSTRLIILRQDGSSKSAWGIDPATGRSWQITPTGARVTGLAPSPNGDEIAYLQQPAPDHWNLIAVRPDGGIARPIVSNGNGFPTGLSWSPRGDLLAYENSEVLGSQVTEPKIWIVRADGAQTSLLYGRGDESGSSPSWSPDGRQLTFYENRYSTISVFNFTKTLLTLPSDVRAPASWSPDGQAFAYTTRTGDGGSRTLVKIAHFVGGLLTETSITDGHSTELRPTWSPDGAWITYVRLGPDGQGGVWVVRPDGKDAHALQNEAGWIYSAPSWAPDSSAIAFSRFRNGNSGSRSETEMWVAPLVGQAHRLDGFGEVVAWVP